jgi:hypothetical protein
MILQSPSPAGYRVIHKREHAGQRRPVSDDTQCMASVANDDDSGDLFVLSYLDTNALLDLLAAAQDGFTLVERISTSQTKTTEVETSATAEFGLPNVLNFFRIGMSGRLAKARGTESSDHREAEVVHTYGSLLHRLLRFLDVEEALRHARNDSEFQELAVGDFVELSGVFRSNPFTSAFRRLQRMLRFFEVAVRLQPEGMAAGATAQVRQSGGKGRAPTNQRPKQAGNPMMFQLTAVSDFLETLTADVEREGTQTIVVEPSGTAYKAVLTLFTDFLRDRSMAELLNREFKVLGKVARNLRDDSGETVNLLASTGIGGFGPEIMGQLLAGFQELGRESNVLLESPTSEISPPVVEIVPIAFYL